MVLYSLCGHTSYPISVPGHKSCPIQHGLYLSYKALGGLAPIAGPAIVAAVVLRPSGRFSANTLHLHEKPEERFIFGPLQNISGNNPLRHLL
jgi:hypothetical protein